MKTEACERYLADPEAHADHLRDCEECGALFGAPPDVSLGRSLARGSLPLAPWEGANHRAWSLVAVAALAVLSGACVLFLAAGVSPLAGITSSLSSLLPSVDIAGSLLFRVSQALRQVPPVWQVAILVMFVVVNTVLFLLLRRSPRGLDV